MVREWADFLGAGPAPFDSSRLRRANARLDFDVAPGPECDAIVRAGIVHVVVLAVERQIESYARAPLGESAPIGMYGPGAAVPCTLNQGRGDWHSRGRGGRPLIGIWIEIGRKVIERVPNPNAPFIVEDMSRAALHVIDQRRGIDGGVRCAGHGRASPARRRGASSCHCSAGDDRSASDGRGAGSIAATCDRGTASGNDTSRGQGTPLGHRATGRIAPRYSSADARSCAIGGEPRSPALGGDRR